MNAGFNLRVKLLKPAAEDKEKADKEFTIQFVGNLLIRLILDWRNQRNIGEVLYSGSTR